MTAECATHRLARVAANMATAEHAAKWNALAAVQRLASDTVFA